MKRTRKIPLVITATLMVAGGAWLAARYFSAAQTPSIHRGSTYDSDLSMSSHAGAERNGGLPITVSKPTMDEIRSRLDPAVFNRIGERTYYVSRMEIRPPGDALAHVVPLRTLSQKGDAIATHQIHLAVTDCKDNFAAGANPKTTPGASASQRLSQFASIERKLTECATLLKDNELMTTNWLSLAAEQGSIEARLFYSIDTESVLGDPRARLADPQAAVVWRENALSYLKEVAGTGSLDALAALSNAYGQGVIVPQDPQLSYAYALVSNRIKHDAYRADLVRSMEKGLSIKQRESAEALSHQIHQSCCQP
ncbi:hypothetical protein [Stenotrophomonas sp. VV52]|uniref:hypothetical protein n=1 Tax=Stenotrophomonas sp. VV52 TaxID=2066958 RepID=UPI000C9E2DCD|nr:hypothetical protein [Stenotrophomonas sp. VV52]